MVVALPIRHQSGVAVRGIVTTVTVEGGRQYKIQAFVDDIVAVEGSADPIESADGRWKIAEGFDKMQYVLDFTSEELAAGPIDPRTIKSVEFDMTVAGDYNIVVIGFSEANRSDDPLAVRMD